MSHQRDEETFDSRVSMVWFRDIGIFNLRAIPTPIGFFSFRELLFVGLGAALTIAGIALFWGNMIGEIVSLLPLAFMFYFAKMRRINMLAPEMYLFAPLLGGSSKISNQSGTKKTKKEPSRSIEASNAMQVTFSEKRPVPAQLNLVVPFTGKEPKPIILLLDGHEVEGTKTSATRIDGDGAHYTLNFVPDATDIGTHKAEVRFAGSTVPIREFSLEVRGEVVRAA